LKPLLLCATLALSFPTAEAVTLITNQSVALPGASAATRPGLAGVVLADVTTSFSYATRGFEAGASGTVRAMVVRSTALGTLDFYWQVSNSAGSLGNVGNLRLANLTADSFDADFRFDQGGSLAPTSALQLSGAALNFQFFRPLDFFYPWSTTGQLSHGMTSDWVYLHTHATAYNMLAIMDVANIYATAASTIQHTFGASPVPEPANWALLGLGLLAIALRRRGISAPG
jgi:hypothetical protein